MPQSRPESYHHSIVWMMFAVTLLLVATLLFIIDKQTVQALNQTTQAIQIQHQKLHHLMNLHMAGQKRSVDLQQVLLHNDIFEQDKALMTFYRDGMEYGRHRDQLVRLLTQSPFEQNWLTELDRGAHQIAPLQDEIAQMAMAGQIEEARNLFLTRATDGLDTFIDQVNQFSNYQINEIQSVISKARHQIDHLMQTVMLLAAALVALSIVFSLFLTRRFNKINENLQKANDNLEAEVHKRTQELIEAQRDLLKQNSLLQHLSSTDPLTQLNNRLEIENILEKQHENHLQKRLPYCVLLIDLDHFKQINDTQGHMTGDRTLQFFADLLRRHFSPAHHLGRWGGEEFIVILEDCDIVHAQERAETFREWVAQQPFETIGHLTLSGGLACPAANESVADLLHRADMALYASKHAGRNRITVSRPESTGGQSELSFEDVQKTI
ncbi:sensor domain-containing diguanylate cyclase [Thiomicrorhabdus cannonii]|uniref:sensor domain-containing diguanylate cyclase n=1 Tax=Thiomicrorhabdus cannonii TaxID=2748011 RepID=UPI0015BB9CD2|nr:diguanylate cyclase [Thiomicrorhabdus cannonii]